MKRSFVGVSINGKKIAEQGAPFLWMEHLVIGVRLTDGTCRVLVVQKDGTMSFWDADEPLAKNAIEHSTTIPAVQHGIGSSVFHVRVTGATGQALVKLYYGWKKGGDFAREDALYPDDPEAPDAPVP